MASPSSSTAANVLDTLPFLPSEIRRAIYDQLPAPRNACLTRAFRLDYYAHQTLTFTISPHPYPRLQYKGRRWPTAISIANTRGFTYPPLFPAFFDYRVVQHGDSTGCNERSLKRHQRYLPLDLYGAVRVEVLAPGPEHPDGLIRAYNCITFLLELFAQMRSPPRKMEVVLVDQLHRWQLDNCSITNVPPFSHDERRKKTPDWRLLLGPLMRLCNVELRFSYPERMTQGADSPAFLAVLDVVKTAARAKSPHRQAAARILFITTWLEVAMTWLPSSALIRERYAFWDISYEIATRVRMATVLCTDGTSPSWKNKAFWKCEEQRRLKDRYNPRSWSWYYINFFVENGALDLRAQYQRTLASAAPSVYAWFSKGLKTPIPKVGDRQYWRDLRKLLSGA